MSEYLEIRNITKEYTPGKGINDVSFSCTEGSFTVILGPSGAGKTTTLSVLAGFLQTTSGDIVMNGHSIRNLKTRERNVSMAFEDYALYPTHSIFENIASPLRARKMDNETISKKVKAIAQLVGIDEHLEKFPSQVSGGQKQRTGLARCLVRDADVYLLDEPIAHLDAKLRHRMRGEFKRIHKELGKTMVYVSHDYREALALADMVIVMNKGSIVQIGPPEEVFSQPKNTFVATLLGDPPMNLVQFDHITVKNGTLSLIGKDFESSVKGCRFPDMKADGVSLGFRDFTVELVAKAGKNTIPGSVYVFEPIEDQIIFTISIAENRVRVRTPRNIKFDLNEEVHIKLNPETIHLFDNRSGDNLEYREE